ncbi:hypothetical protein IWW34DRAFT_239480 [Fusarium oxysporum f. sp. albedinis]|nr:hypothetical protein IWW34DRAFT_239480 [Fusarium oxysporum f. sp. albedinis]
MSGASMVQGLLFWGSLTWSAELSSLLDAESFTECNDLFSWSMGAPMELTPASRKSAPSTFSELQTISAALLRMLANSTFWGSTKCDVSI